MNRKRTATIILWATVVVIAAAYLLSLNRGEEKPAEQVVPPVQQVQKPLAELTLGELVQALEQATTDDEKRAILQVLVMKDPQVEYFEALIALIPSEDYPARQEAYLDYYQRFPEAVAAIDLATIYQESVEHKLSEYTLAWLEEKLKRRPKDRAVYLQAAAAAEAMGKDARAVELLQRAEALSSSGKHRSTQIKLLTLLLKLERFDEATDVGLALLEGSEDRDQVLVILKKMIRCDVPGIARVLEYLQVQAKESEDDVDDLWALREFFILMDCPGEARRVAKEIFESDAGLGHTVDYLESLQDAAEYEEMLEVFESYFGKDPQRFRQQSLLQTYLDVARTLGKKDLELELMRRDAEANAVSGSRYVKLAKKFMADQRFDDALAAVDDAIDQAGKWPHPGAAHYKELLTLAKYKFLAQAGRLDEAEAGYRRFFPEMCGNPNFRNGLNAYIDLLIERYPDKMPEMLYELKKSCDSPVMETRIKLYIRTQERKAVKAREGRMPFAEKRVFERSFRGHLEAEDWSAARDMLAGLAEKYPKEVVLHRRQLVEAFFESGGSDEETRKALLALAEAGDAFITIQFAIAAKKKGEWDEAFGFYEQAVTSTTHAYSRQQLRLTVGELYVRRGKEEKAREHFRAAVKGADTRLRGLAMRHLQTLEKEKAEQ